MKSNCYKFRDILTGSCTGEPHDDVLVGADAPHLSTRSMCNGVQAQRVTGQRAVAHRHDRQAA
jgi:hypothetical protein